MNLHSDIVTYICISTRIETSRIGGIGCLASLGSTWFDRPQLAYYEINLRLLHPRFKKAFGDKLHLRKTSHRRPDRRNRVRHELLCCDPNLMMAVKTPA